MKLFSEYIFGLFPFPAPPPPDVVAVVFVNRAELGCNKSGYGRAGGGGCGAVAEKEMKKNGIFFIQASTVTNFGN